MKKIILSFSISAAIFGAVLSSAQTFEKKQLRQSRSPFQASGAPRYAVLNINNLTCWLRADGISSRTPSDGDGTTFPRGIANVVYQDGLMWGGQAYMDAARTQPAPFNQLIRVGGVRYFSGTREGRIIGFGVNALPADPNDPNSRLFRIRRDYFFMNEDELRRDAAETYEIAPGEVTPAQIQAVRAQYEKDWQEWPVAFDAPFIDRNANGVYDPPPPFSSSFTVEDLIRGGYDEPGLTAGNPNAPAPQVVWTVCNDLDRTQTLAFQGAEPMGLEAQITLWAYNNSETLGNVFFRRTRLINRGGVQIDSAGAKGAFWIDGMYLGQWSDVDIGDFNDDLVGCDTLLGIGYGYNSATFDQRFRRFNLAPPAFGYDVVQGPRVLAAGSTALFDFKKIPDFKNLPMTSFVYTTAGSLLNLPLDYRGALRWYKWLRGFFPYDGDVLLYYPFPPGVTPGPFPLSGDPVVDAGFIDGQGFDYSIYPGDRRIVVNSGPFKLAPGDTQEIVIAGIAGLGADRLSSIAIMRQTSRAVQALYDGLFAITPPKFSAHVSYPDSNSAVVKITAEAQASEVAAVHIFLKRRNGTPVIATDLFDDGMHDDAAAGDGVFANIAMIAREPEGLLLDATATDQMQRSQTFPEVLGMMTTAGVIEISTPEIFSDNLNNDGQANAGENIRYGVILRNQTAFDFNNLRIFAMKFYANGTFTPIPSLPAGGVFSMHYEPYNSQSYLDFEVPPNFSEPAYRLPIVVLDQRYNQWQDTLAFPIVPPPAPFIETLLRHVAGKADGNFAIRIVDRTVLKNHEYQIVGVDSIDAAGNRGFTLKDMTDGRVLLQNHPLSDTLGHSFPVIDGFKILRGTLPDQLQGGMAGWAVPHGKRVWTWAGGANELGFEGFNGAIGWAEPHSVFVGAEKTLRATELTNTLIKFAATDTNGNVLDPNDSNWSYAYRYGRGFGAPVPFPPPCVVNRLTGYAYQEYKKSAPFSAWDIESAPPRRLMIGHLENYVAGGMVDCKYWPPDFHRANNVVPSGPREWFFIFNVEYAETPKPELIQEMLNNPLPIMWFGTPARNGNIVFEAGDEFLIFARHFITSQDVWAFNPTTVSVAQTEIPLSFELMQNYPNPLQISVSNETFIAFSLPLPNQAKLQIFNTLGQEVATLVDKKMQPGRYIEAWRGVDRLGRPVASGIYFYRLQAGDQVQMKKLLLLR